MTNNLWEILKFDDLVFLLKNAEKKFVVLSIITDETSSNIKKIIKKTIKDKSKNYPKVTFLLYKAKTQDFGKLQPMFNKDIAQYPKIFHVWNVQEILAGVISVDNKEIIESSFEDFHDVYLQGELPSHNDTETENEKKEEIKNNNEENTREVAKINTPPNTQHNVKQYTQPPIIQNRDPVLEKKKFNEKLHLLRQKQEDCTLEFLSEFKQRKEEEEGEKEKKKKTK
jgi:hypothetical protein